MNGFANSIHPHGAGNEFDDGHDAPEVSSGVASIAYACAIALTLGAAILMIDNIPARVLLAGI